MPLTTPTGTLTTAPPMIAPVPPKVAAPTRQPRAAAAGLTAAVAVYALGVTHRDDLAPLFALGFDGATGPAVGAGAGEAS